jgi:hypothetical protein
MPDKQRQADVINHPSPSRRKILVFGAFGAGAALLSELVLAQQVTKEIRELQQGEFSWHPERSPSGPVAIVVSLPDQRVHVYRNGIRIAVSTCSTGKVGHSTPTGVFTIIEKDRDHHSSTYNDAPMPNMNRLTWSGVALHAGQLPGYPASHGCVRLPLEFSRLLFGVTQIGTPVIIANDHSDPVRVAHPGLVLDPDAKRKMDDAVAKASLKPQPGYDHIDNATPPLAVLVSRADQKVVVLENGDIIAQGKAIIRYPQMNLGSHVFVLSDATDGHTYWHGIGHHADAQAELSDVATLQRIACDDDLTAILHARMHPGAVLTTTDLSLTTDTRSGKDFVIVTAATS